MSKEVDDHLLDMSRLSKNLGLIWSGLGSSEVSPALTPRMPKARYDIMRSYLPQKGNQALHMMHSTCTIQTNLDFSDATDAMKKLRASLYLQPIVMAMFANSFLLDNQLRSGSCARSNIWLNTDPDRYLYPASFLDEDTPLDTYIQWALSVPMFFIAREGQYLNCSGLPFSTFLKEGYNGHQATMGDFELHLSTLFPDARLKQFLEVRGADMGPSSYIKVLPAWHVGLLYDSINLDRVIDRFEGISADQLWETRARLDQEGLDTLLGDRPLIDWAQECTQWAREGLFRFEPESVHLLNPLIENLNLKKCPADLYRPIWEKGGAEAVRKAAQIC
jgi:glutamate--cysteine ligase